MKYIKSPLNYIGGKGKLLKDIIPILNSTNSKNFIDLFAGGLNVGINSNAKNLFVNDLNKFVLEVLEYFKNNSFEDVNNKIEKLISNFNLSKTNEEGFKELRNLYNESDEYHIPVVLYTLVCYSFNYQFRFNNSHDYNSSFGKNRSSYTKNMKEKLSNFIGKFNSFESVEFSSNDYLSFDLDRFKGVESDTILYLDPPYLITGGGTYNDGNRGFKSWGCDSEMELLQYISMLNQRGFKFMLSNVIQHKGETNVLLDDWLQKNNFTVKHLNIDYSNSSYNAKNGKSDEIIVYNF